MTNEVSYRFSTLAQQWIFLSISNCLTHLLWDYFYMDEGVKQADFDTPADWVKTGQAFQRFGLTAAKLGISHAHLNMPCEVKEVRQKLITELGLESKNPLLLIRYGFAAKMPYSMRRPIEEVIVK